MTDSAAAGKAGEPGAGQWLAIQLENQQLQAEVLALRQRVEQLTVKVAHDLRAPLRHIGAFVQVIEEDHGTELDADVSGHLQTIREAAASMSLMLEDLLQKR